MSDPDPAIDPAMPLSADLAATALWLRERADNGVKLDPVACVFLAEALDEIAVRVRELEDELRGRHVEAVADTLDARRETAIVSGVVSGKVLDLRAALTRELAARGRPTPPHLLDARDDDGGDAA